MSKSKIPLADYRGLVAKVCWKHYRMFPASVRLWYEVEDLINDCYVRLATAIKGYDAEKGSPATFIRTVCTYHCLQVLEHHCAAQRSHERLSMDIAMEAVLPSHRKYETMVLAKHAIETMLRRQDDPELRWLVSAACGEHEKGRRIRLDAKRIDKLRKAFRACGITYADLRSLHIYDLYPRMAHV